MNALVNIETLTAATVFAEGGVETIISKLETDVRAMPKPDASTEAGRDEIKSLAYKIARTKTGLDGLGKDHVADLKKRAGAIDAQRRIICERLDALKDEVRKPVIDWETSEAARIGEHERALAQMADASLLMPDITAEAIEARLQTVRTVYQRDWQEFGERADAAVKIAETILRPALAAARQREADAAELARLRAENAAREERVRQEAAAKAAEESAARAQREAEERERERAAKAERDKQAAIDAALEAQRRKQEEEAARAAAAKAAQEAAEQRRQSNARHRARIHREITEALSEVLTGNADEAAALIEAIVAGRIPHLVIEY